jgi:hypothetical protein
MGVLTTKFRVAYRLAHVDHMDITLDYDTREEAVKEVQRLSGYHDLVYLCFKEIPSCSE